MNEHVEFTVKVWNRRGDGFTCCVEAVPHRTFRRGRQENSTLSLVVTLDVMFFITMLTVSAIVCILHFSFRLRKICT